MRRTMLKSKIHRATVTDTKLDYEGSLTIDANLLDGADILPNEQIHVWNVTNGNRMVTYAIEGEAGSGVIQVNGGGAHLNKKGDVIIIATFTELKTKEARKYYPTVVYLDTANRVTEKPVGVPQTPPVVSLGDAAQKPTKKRTTRKT